jgi:tetratricopeptide (TPR) repeat protein
MAGLFLLGASVSAGSMPGQAESPVVVVDFEVPAASDHAWDWAGGGVADLLQQELAARGVPVVDRNSLRALEAEQRLSLSGLAKPDSLRVGGLLGAGLVVGGRVAAAGPGRARLETWLASVEQAERIATAYCEGAWPNDLTAMLGTLAEQLAGKAGARTDKTPPPVAAGDAIRPEALVMFYEGVNACARRQPVLGVAFFLNAYGIDSRLTAARAWEIRAYELAGLPEHARTLKAGLPAAATSPVSGAKPVVASAPAAAKVVAILTPQVAGTDDSAATFWQALEQAALADRRVRLFGAENLMPAVAEQDAQLSGLFANGKPSRYGNWLMADGFVQCRVEPGDAALCAVRLSLVDPLSGQVMAEVRERADPADIAARLPGALSRLVDAWLAGTPLPAGATAAKPAPPAELAEADLARLPAHRELAVLLDTMSRGKADIHTHQNMVKPYLDAGELSLAALAAAKFYDALEESGPDALSFREAYIWLVWSVRFPTAVFELVPKERLARLNDGLCNKHLDLIARGGLAYGHARKAYDEKRWADAVRHANESLAVFSQEPPVYEVERQLAGMTAVMRKEKKNVKGSHYYDLPLASLHFIIGDSLRHAGRLDEARGELLAARAFRTEVFVEIVATWFYGDNGWIPQFAGHSDLQKRLALSLAGFDGRNSAAYDAIRAETEPAGTVPVCFDLVNRIIAGWNSEPPEPGPMLPACVAEMEDLLHWLGHRGQQARLGPVLEQVAAAYLRHTGLAVPAAATAMPADRVVERLRQVLRFYEQAECVVPKPHWVNHQPLRLDDAFTAAGWRHAWPFLQPPWPPELGWRILGECPCLLGDGALAVSYLQTRQPAAAPATVARAWAKIGLTESLHHHHDKALLAFREARANDSAITPDALSLVVIEVALASRPDAPGDETQRLCATVAPPLAEPNLWHWFNVVRRNQQAGNLSAVLACYAQIEEMASDANMLKNLRKTPPFFPGFDGATIRLNAQFGRAECLAKLGRRDEAAALYRQIAIDNGNQEMMKIDYFTPIGGARFYAFQFGSVAAERAEQLHRVEK